MATMVNVLKTIDFLEVAVSDRVDQQTGYSLYGIHCTKTDAWSKRRWRSEHYAKDQLKSRREFAVKIRPHNPASMTRWLLGMPLIREHD